MARVPFARRSSSDYITADSDSEKLPRDKEIVQRSSSGIGSFKSPSKSRKRRRIESENASNGGPSNRARKPGKPRIAKQVPLIGKFRKIPTKSNIGEDEQPLLSTDEANATSDDVFIDIPVERSASSETRPATSKTWRFCSVIVFLLFLVTGLTLIISVHVKSDFAARDINPAVFHYYKIALIGIFILWLVFEYHQNWNAAARNEDFEPLIPSHLLTGLALFGVCNSGCQGIVIVDFIKCSRNVSGLDKSYVASAIFEMLFVFCQIYVFYTLSCRRKQKLWFGNFFTMFTLAINLTLWAGYFCAGAVNHPDLKNVTWIRHYYYGQKEDLCRLNNSGHYSRKLHELSQETMMTQFQFTFAMEYSLLASALLLHVWLELETPSAGEFGSANKKWDVWRFGFIAGLFSLPLMSCFGVLSTVEHNLTNIVFLYIFQFGLLFLIFVGSCRGLWLFKKYYTRKTNNKALKVDLILLCFSWLGYLILDMFTIFASLAETWKSFRAEIFTLGLASLGELLCLSVLTVFIFASYFYEVRLSEDGIKAAKMIRQIASFGITVSFGFWAIRTYTFRLSKYYFDFAGWKYFGTTAWFAITQFSTPMCIFYHFHCAVCLFGIVADSTI